MVRKVVGVYKHSSAIDQTISSLEKAGYAPKGKLNYPNFSIKVEVPVTDKSEKNAEEILKGSGADKIVINE